MTPTESEFSIEPISKGIVNLEARELPFANRRDKEIRVWKTF